MYLFITILIVIAALLLAFVVIIQNSKGGGLAAGFSSSNQVMGVRKTTDFLEKATWSLAAAIVILCLAASKFTPRHAAGGVPSSEIEQNIMNAKDPNAMPFPNQPAPNNTPAEGGESAPAQPQQ